MKAEQLAIDLPLPKQLTPAWRLPPVALLRKSKQADVDRRQVEILGQTLEGALAAHGVETRLVGATVGPSVTRYELELAPGVKVGRVTALQRDIAYAMAAAECGSSPPFPAARPSASRSPTASARCHPGRHPYHPRPPGRHPLEVAAAATSPAGRSW